MYVCIYSYTIAEYHKELELAGMYVLNAAYTKDDGNDGNTTRLGIQMHTYIHTYIHTYMHAL